MPVKNKPLSETHKQRIGASISRYKKAFLLCTALVSALERGDPNTRDRVVHEMMGLVRD
jgi:hypothetical protein